MPRKLVKRRDSDDVCVRAAQATQQVLDDWKAGNRQRPRAAEAPPWGWADDRAVAPCPAVKPSGVKGRHFFCTKRNGHDGPHVFA